MPPFDAQFRRGSEIDDPTVIFLGEFPSTCPEVAQLDLACRFYGFRLVAIPYAQAGIPTINDRRAPALSPILVVVHASDLATAGQSIPLRVQAESYGAPVAVVGITAACEAETLAPFAAGTRIRAIAATATTSLWVNVTVPTDVGFELRGVPLALDSESASCLGCSDDPAVHVLATIGTSLAQSVPALLRIRRDGTVRYLLARTTSPDPEGIATWQFRRSHFGEIAPCFLLLRDVGGPRCWHPPGALANLTIDDPWLTEPYGCLSYPGLLEQMRRAHFHATIGFVPWNFDRSAADVVALLRANPEHYSIAVHGNNHDRFEFFRYEARTGDRHRAKPLAQHETNIRQAMARMETFRRLTGLDYDRVMVFPHAVCPAATFGLLKRCGFWATFNYSNVPLDERPPADPVIGLRSANAQWSGFPALRRSYPQNYSDEAIAIDLFLGNPVLFMAHQDLFFDGIDAFTAHAQRVNGRQPAVRWTSLGEISRLLHLLRWLDDRHCDVRLLSHHARIENPQSVAALFQFSKHETAPEAIDRVTVDGAETPWAYTTGKIRFAATLPPGGACLVEVHYRHTDDPMTVDVRRRGLRNRILRFLADFRDITLSRSLVGRVLTRKYYRTGKRRPTVSFMLSKLHSFLRGKPPDGASFG